MANNTTKVRGITAVAALRQFMRNDPKLRNIAFSQANFARTIGFSKSTVSLVENRVLVPSPRMRESIKEAFGISDTWLAGMCRPGDTPVAADGQFATLAGIYNNLGLASPGRFDRATPARERASYVAAKVEQRLIESLEVGDMRLLKVIERVLRLAPEPKCRKEWVKP